MNVNTVKYSQGKSFLQLTLAKKTKTKNVCCATLDIVVSQSSSCRILI